MYRHLDFGLKRRVYGYHYPVRLFVFLCIAWCVVCGIFLLTLLSLGKPGLFVRDVSGRKDAGGGVEEFRDAGGVHKALDIVFRYHVTEIDENKDSDVGPYKNGSYRTSLNGVVCPTYNPASLDLFLLSSKQTDGIKLKNTLQSRYQRMSNCIENDLWQSVNVDYIYEVIYVIVRLANVKRNSFVLHWGSGCGRIMHLLWKELDVRSVGMDVLNPAISYARNTTSNELLHCVADETNMTWIPSNTFDHVISFDALRYVSNHTLFCHVLRQMVRVIKPSGTVYNGWYDDSNFKQSYVPLCFADLPVTYEIMEEREVYSRLYTFPLKVRWNVRNTHSLVVTKNSGRNSVSDDVYDNIEAVTLRFGGGPKGTDFRATSHAMEPSDVALDKESMKEREMDKAEGFAVGGDSVKKGEITEAMASQKPMESVPSVVWPECPPYDPAVAKRQIPIEHLPRKKPTSVAQKYDRRAGNCYKDGLWHRVSINDHRAILRIIAKLIGVTNSSRLFDWGSGCGHHLQFMYEYFGAVGLGIDISNKTIEYARAMMTRESRYCVADGTHIEWLPSNFFDQAYSFGSIYHVYNKTLFCSVLRQMVRIVKMGGKVYNGFTEDAEFPRSEVQPCLLADMDSSCVQVEIFEEKKLFREVPYFPLKAKRRHPNTYSLLIHKLSC